MSIADIAARSPRITRTDAKVMTLDIERLPGRARHQHRGLTIEGDFWDLNSWKHTIGYRLPPESVIEWPRTICVAWRFYGNKTTQFASEWTDGRDDMLRRVWAAYDEAEIVYGHNVDRFDTKNLNAEWLTIGLNPPSPFKILDTLKEARRTFGFESNTLASLTDRLGIDTKTDKYEVAVARAACAGDKAAQRKLKAYNIGDIAASEALVDRLRGWLPSHPHLGALDEAEERCNACGSTDLERNGTYLAVQIRYIAYRCNNCGANLRGATHSRAANVRGAR